MILSFNVNAQTVQIDTEQSQDISIPLRFDGEQPNAFGVERAVSTACEAGTLIGDTRRGGSCNFEQITLIPHCNGTHTECVGHLTRQRIAILDCLREAFSPAVLTSVEPENAAQTSESYVVAPADNDLLITRKVLEQALTKLELPISSDTALIIRTIPNGKSKLSQIYRDEVPPFFSTEAMEFINEIGVRHLLVDLPSIDRIYDQGKLANHRIFWGVEPGSFSLSDKSLVHRTITELIYVPDEIADGWYLLNLQIAPFAADAAPSRPLLFRILHAQPTDV
jgi:arylformamidase